MSPELQNWLRKQTNGAALSAISYLRNVLTKCNNDVEESVAKNLLTKFSTAASAAHLIFLQGCCHAARYDSQRLFWRFFFFRICRRWLQLRFLCMPSSLAWMNLRCQATSQHHAQTLGLWVNCSWPERTQNIPGWSSSRPSWDCGKRKRANLGWSNCSQEEFATFLSAPSAYARDHVILVVRFKNCGPEY